MLQAAEVARKVAASPELTEHCRCLFAFASHEEIGRFGSRVLAQELRPDVLIVRTDADVATQLTALLPFPLAPRPLSTSDGLNRASGQFLTVLAGYGRLVCEASASLTDVAAAL